MECPQRLKCAATEVILLCLMSNVLPEADVQCPHFHTIVLHLAPLTFDQIDHTLGPVHTL